MADFVIETHNLGKQYGDVLALEDLNLTVPQNAIFGFLGPNGAGKTTAMKLLLGAAMGTLFGGQVLPVGQLALYTPWPLFHMVLLPVMGQPIAPELNTVLVSTAVWSLIFIVAAIWQMNRLEF